MDDSKPSLPLFEAATRGSREAMEDLIEGNLPELRAFVQVHVGPALAAKDPPSDIVQSACREVLLDAENVSFSSDGHLRRWLFQAALRKIQDKARYWNAEKRDPGREAASPSWKPMVDLLASPTTPSQIAMGAEAARRLEAAYDELSDDSRAVFERIRLFGMSYGEVAEELDLTEQNIRKIYSRAAARLLRRLDETRS